MAGAGDAAGGQRRLDSTVLRSGTDASGHVLRVAGGGDSEIVQTTPAKQVTPPRAISGRVVAEPRRRGDFIPLRLLDAPTAWEVIHPRGYRVRVRGEVSAATLQCIVGVFDGGRHA